MKKLVIALAAVVCVTLAAGQAQATLVGHWTFDNPDNIGKDFAGSNDGIVYGAAWTSEGQIGGALDFDGIDDYVLTGTTGRPTNTFSFGGWLKTSLPHERDTESASLYDYGGIAGQKYAFSPHHEADLNAGAGLSVGINGISVYEHGDDYMPATAVYPENIEEGWNHIMIVYDDKQPAIYLNGSLFHTGLTSPRATVYAPIQFGGMVYGFFDGLIDEVAIWNEALDADAVKDVYLNGVPEPATVALLGLGGLVLIRRKRTA